MLLKIKSMFLVNLFAIGIVEWVSQSLWKRDRYSTAYMSKFQRVARSILERNPYLKLRNPFSNR